MVRLFHFTPNTRQKGPNSEAKFILSNTMESVWIDTLWKLFTTGLMNTQEDLQKTFVFLAR